MTSRSPLLESFDPFATHPFTNTSGLQALPPQPSQYPRPLPSPHHSYQTRSFLPQSPDATPLSSPGSQYFIPETVRVPTQAPRPTRLVPPPAATTALPPRPIFEPYRQETSSPDLVLKKQSITKSKSADKKQ